mgnify:CR=1 FL=1
MKWAVSYMQDDGTVHVYPLFGKEHQFPELCWCNSTQDEQDNNLWIHHLLN